MSKNDLNYSWPELPLSWTPFIQYEEPLDNTKAQSLSNAGWASQQLLSTIVLQPSMMMLQRGDYRDNECSVRVGYVMLTVEEAEEIYAFLKAHDYKFRNAMEDMTVVDQNPNRPTVDPTKPLIDNRS